MADEKSKQQAGQKPAQTDRNEGEGNRTAARVYNEAQEDFAKSGKAEPAARDAANALSGPEAEELRRAEEAAKRRSRGEDPAVKR